MQLERSTQKQIPEKNKRIMKQRKQQKDTNNIQRLQQIYSFQYENHFTFSTKVENLSSTYQHTYFFKTLLQ